MSRYDKTNPLSVGMVSQGELLKSTLWLLGIRQGDFASDGSVPGGQASVSLFANGKRVSENAARAIRAQWGKLEAERKQPSELAGVLSACSTTQQDLAREGDVPGGQAAVSNFISGHRPVSANAARAIRAQWANIEAGRMEGQPLSKPEAAPVKVPKAPPAKYVQVRGTCPGCKEDVLNNQARVCCSGTYWHDPCHEKRRPRRDENVEATIPPQVHAVVVGMGDWQDDAVAVARAFCRVEPLNLKPGNITFLGDPTSSKVAVCPVSPQPNSPPDVVFRTRRNRAHRRQEGIDCGGRDHFLLLRAWWYWY
jgi:hypothetical protein